MTVETHSKPRPQHPQHTQPTPQPTQPTSAHDGDQGQGHGAHGGGHEEEVIPKDLPQISNGVMVVVALVFAALLAALFLVGYLPHRQRMAEAENVANDANAKPIVDIVQPRRESRGFDLVLPGDARAMQETSLFPQASGYLKKLNFDIGDKVKAGDVMAEIDIPEVDAQLNESQAQLQQIKTNVAKAQADYELAQSTWNRYDSLAKTGNGAITQQDLDEKLAALNQSKAALDSTKAAVTASEAAVQRLVDMQAFSKVTAPFDGIVSARNYDIGALLSPSNATTSGGGRELFRLTRSNTLRVFVNVPQSYAESIKIGQPAVFTVKNFPGRKFNGSVTRTTGAIDPNTRTLRMQIDLPNPDYTLWAGMYGQVSMQVTPANPPLIVPTSAMMFQSDGTKVAVVDDSGKIAMKKVALGRDFGTELEIADGLNGDEKVVSNPGERLSDGVAVQVLQKKPAAPTGTANATPGAAPSTQTAEAAGK